MAGHSKWANIKHRKGRQDARRSKIWSKCSRAIIVAAKNGGSGDPAMNLTLRYAIDEAKAQNMPKDTIAKAIEKGTGGGDGVSYEEILYEGYGPNGVAIMLDILTDNRNRAAMEVRTAVTRNGGTMADPGSVSRLFERKGVVVVPKAQESREVSEDDVLEATLDAGAEEVKDHGDSLEVQSEATDVVAVRTSLQDAGIDYDSAEVQFVATLDIPVAEPDVAAKVFKLVDAVDDLDDVQNVFVNADIPDDVMEAADV